MNSQISYYNTKVDKPMSPEQFTEIVEAILAGKYSWACVLLLRFAGYNPLHYIPYRTYNRLIKENCQGGRVGKHKTPSLNASNQHSKANGTSEQKCYSKISDLAHLQVVGEEHTSVRGGNLELRQIPLFAQRSSEHLQWLALEGTEVSLTAGTKIAQQGDSPDGFYAILSGQTEWMQRVGDRQTHAVTLGAGEIFAPAAFDFG